ncbi:MAG: NAD-dependent dehydratase [Rickettsiales bacterium]|nr:NAD-dependent dehydratase [Rickettsiales bacterium]|tara:strand:+ start:751 stop:1749 length:999 start_codon:yes stop_codon:yes gene_type:complete
MVKKILITGANGFLGSAITKLGIKKGYKVNIFVRKNSDLTNLKPFLSKLKIYYGNLEDIESLNQPIKDSDIIFHVAADYRLWSRKPAEIYAANVLGTENIAHKTLTHNKMLIYTSSVATLKLKKNSVSDENFEAKFDDMTGDYKKSKFLAEKIISSFTKKKKLKAIIVNPSTPIGEGDIKPTPTGKIILDVLNKDMPAYVDTGLNFVHVDDVAEGHFLAQKYGKIGEKYILGGENLNFKDFLDLVSEIGNVPKVKFKINQKYLYFFAFINEILARYIFRYNPSLTLDGLKMSEKKMFFSSEKAKKLLRYRPRNVKNAIKDSVNWTKNHFKLK